jgi:hypothetical protein
LGIHVGHDLASFGDLTGNLGMVKMSKAVIHWQDNDTLERQ